MEKTLKASEMSPSTAVARRLARAAEGALRPTVTIAGRSISTFQLCGLAGFAAAVGAAFALGARLGLSLALLAALSAAAAGTFLVVVLLTRTIIGEERLVYYHHELAVLAVAALTLAALGRPVLAYLDVAIVSLGVFLAAGSAARWSVAARAAAPSRATLPFGARGRGLRALARRRTVVPGAARRVDRGADADRPECRTAVGGRCATRRGAGLSARRLRVAALRSRARARRPRAPRLGRPVRGAVDLPSRSDWRWSSPSSGDGSPRRRWMPRWPLSWGSRWSW